MWFTHSKWQYREIQNVHSYIYIQICCGVIHCSWNNAWLNTCTHGVHWCRGHSVEVCCTTGGVGRGVVQPSPAEPRGACDGRYDPNSCLIPHRTDSGPTVPKACRESLPKTRLATTIMPNWTHWPLALSCPTELTDPWHCHARLNSLTLGTIMPNWTRWPLARKTYLRVLCWFCFTLWRRDIRYWDGLKIGGGFRCVCVYYKLKRTVTFQHSSHLLLFWPNQNALVSRFLAHRHKCYHQSQHTSIK